MLASETLPPDPLAIALRRKAATGGAGTTSSAIVGEGEGWRAVDIVCTSGPPDRPFEERQASTSISLVLSGTFVYRSDRGSSLMSPGALLLGNAGQAFVCSHQHGEGDRCLSFQFDPGLFERVAHEAGASRPVFGGDRVPPLRALAPLTSRARMAIDHPDVLEEIALELAGAVIEVAGDVRRSATGLAAGDVARVTRVLRRVEACVGERQTLSDLAQVAGLSRYHFLRTFTRVTGVTPHQWVLRMRLREAARRLVASRDAVTAIALAVGFDDLSNFIRSFRAELGVAPSRYRATTQRRIVDQITSRPRRR